MNTKALLGWPLFAIPLMVLMGWAVGPGSTPLDDWVSKARNSPLRWLLFFSDLRVVVFILLSAVAVALYRRQWVLAAVALLVPYSGVWIARACKALFGRQRNGALAYPSGHTTLLVVVLGMVLLIFGAQLWLVVASIVWVSLGMVGLAVNYHYFTDTVGAVLLGTSLVCLASILTGVKLSWRRVTIAV